MFYMCVAGAAIDEGVPRHPEGLVEGQRRNCPVPGFGQHTVSLERLYQRVCEPLAYFSTREFMASAGLKVRRSRGEGLKWR